MARSEYKGMKYKPEIKPVMLKWIRLSRNLSQSDVAEKLEISQKMISDYENGKYEDFSPNVYARVRELIRAYRVDRFELESYKKLMEIKGRRGYKV
ncbi:helix-turn-helix domain-containing protein [Bacillus paranthracis]|nr:transcriptional regulator [Bacillus cereus]